MFPGRILTRTSESPTPEILKTWDAEISVEIPKSHLIFTSTV